MAEAALIKHMVGREIDNIYPERGAASDPTRSSSRPELAGLLRQAMAGISSRTSDFKLRKGEIVGFAGLMGSGRTELAKSIFGNPDGYAIAGELFVNGQEAALRESQARRSRPASPTPREDRKGNGLMLIQDVKQNITLANLEAMAQRGVVDKNAEVKVANEYKTALSIKTPSIEQVVGNLSGGNQQKVSVAKWLFVKPEILILDEPTRGIDVGAKYEIYTIMNRLWSRA